MKFKKSIKVSINIVLIFGLAMLMSIVPDLYPSFFGDWKCLGSGQMLEHSCHFERCDYSSFYHTPEYHWGYRHYLYLFMGICLFIVQVSRVILIIKEETN